MKRTMKSSVWLCVVICLFTAHTTDVVHAIYDPSATTTKPPIRRESILPWYLNGSNFHPPDDGSRAAKWSQPDDFRETQQSLEPYGGTWGNWRKVSGSEIEQRTEVEAAFGRKPIQQYSPAASDQAWLNEPFVKTTNSRGSDSYDDAPIGIFDDEANIAANRKNPSTRNFKYKPQIPGESPNLYEGVPFDSKKPRQARIIHPFRQSQTSNIAKYDQRTGVECPNSHATGQFVYPPDCKFFVNCHQGRAFVVPCAPGTLFSPDTLECDFPNKVRCYGGEIADFPNSDYTDGNGRREPLVKFPQGHRQIGAHRASNANEPRCLAQQSGYFPHPTDCTKFLQCANGGTFIKDCGPGTVFNPAISVCDWPYNVMGCEDALKKSDVPPTLITPPEIHPYENYQTNPSDSWKPVTKAQQPVKKVECPPGHSGLLPHPDTCKKFLQCANGMTYIMDCGPGTAFNPAISVCDWPYNVPGCSQERTTQIPKFDQHSDHRAHEANWNNHESGDRFIQGRPSTGHHDQTAGSSNRQQEARVVVNGNQDWTNRYENRGESQIGNQWQPGYSRDNTNGQSGSDGRQTGWTPKPTLDPRRPFQPHNHDGSGPWDHSDFPKSHEDGISQMPSKPYQWQHHNHDYHHRQNARGPWDHRNHEETGEEDISQVPSKPDSTTNGWQHHTHDYHHRQNGPRSWDHSGHNHEENGDEEISQVPSKPDNNPNGWQSGNHYHQGGYHNHQHDHSNGKWNWENKETTTQTPNAGYPSNDRGVYGRTNPNFPGESRPNGDSNWKPSLGLPTSKPNTQWSNHGIGMKPSHTDSGDSQSGVFHSNSWRGDAWDQSERQNPKPIPTLPPKTEWNQGGNKSPQDRKLDDWLSRTNVIQYGDSRKEEDTKLNDWRLKTNIFNAQQGNNHQGVKKTEGTEKIGSSGIYVNVNGVKGHYITTEIEVNQGHSNTKKYGKDNNNYDDSYTTSRPIEWNPKSTYPSKYEPIRFNATNNRWKYKPVNDSRVETIPDIYENPNYEKYPKITTEIRPIFTTEKSIFDGFTKKTPVRTHPPIELPEVVIEDDRRNERYNSNAGKENETLNFDEIIEPSVNKYDVDVLDEKEKWKPKLTFENKTKKSNDNSVIMKINKKSTELEILDVKMAPWHEDETPFPVYYVAPVYPMDYVPKPMIMAPGSGQILRLRGGNSPREGYLEVQGIHPGWGVVCDSRNGWSLNEAHVVCRQLGYTRGAEMAWQGRSQWDEDEIPWIAATQVNCKGNETIFQACKFIHDEECKVKRDAVGIRCMANRVAYCGKDEIAHDGQCYHLAKPDSGLNHAEALEYCAARKSQLIDITSQAENNFLSEWLIQTYPEVTSIMTSGVGFTTFNRTIFMWEDSARAKFQFSRWWPGWMQDRKLPPWAGSRPVCIVMKKEFPCQSRPESNCPTDYFFWDIEDCASSIKGHSYVCERPYNDIGCVYGKGQQYAGNANVSASGKDCLPWNDKKLAHALRVNVLNQEIREKLMTHNYCRNPNPMKESKPWCFIEFGEREYCDIPACGKMEPRKPRGGQCKPKHFECMPGECIPSPWVCDGEEDCTNGLDERSCSSYLGFFEKTRNHKLEGHDVEKWLNTPQKTCALRCREADFTCRSFSHKSEGNVCLLSDTNVGASGDLRYDVDFDYYEMIDRSVNCEDMFVCGNQKCVNKTQVCDGKNDCGDRTDENICTVESLDYNIRLAGSNNSYEGRVEVRVLGHWGQVCDDGFGMIDANIVCKELGFDLGALEVRAGGYYGNIDPPERFMVDQLKCRGNETSIRECDFDGWGVHNCLPEEAVGVVCKSAVNTCPLGQWKCDNSPTCIPTPFICDEVVDCPDESDENSAHCDAPFELRLANGSSPLEGRIEIRHHGVWGTVCDDDFSQNAAKVICKSLGYGGRAIPKKNGFFGPGDGPIWLDEVYCHGNEPQLYKCDHDNWGRSNCDHDEDAGVICSEGSISDSELEDTDTTAITEININELLPSDCGKRPEDFGNGEDEIFQRVVRGSIAPKGSYPWQASIRVRGHSRSSHWCGAVVLSPLHVLTAAHCLEGYNKGTYFIRAGDYNSEIVEGTEVEANIEDYYVHEDFRKGQRMNNDIALVLLKGRGIPLGEHVMPICLPPANAEYSTGLNCTISGFGSIETGRSAQSQNLRFGWVPLIDQSICRANYVYGEGKISDGMVCAGYLNEGVDSCDGDSGGPLACIRNGAYTLYGVTSWGHHCGEPNKPGVYVRISYYRDWIEKKIRESLFGR